jgi:hypothetical protein
LASFTLFQEETARSAFRLQLNVHKRSLHGLRGTLQSFEEFWIPKIHSTREFDNFQSNGGWLNLL